MSPLTNERAPLHPLFHQHLDLLEGINGVIQVGAHVGEEVARWCGAGIKHQLYFEPQGEPFSRLQSEIERHCRDYDARAFRCAVADRCEIADFFCTESTTMSSLLLPADVPQLVTMDNAIMRQVRCVSLDRFFTMQPLFQPTVLSPQDYDLLFCDAQGADCRVIQGAEKLLRNYGMKVVVAEVAYRRVYHGGMLAPEFHDLMKRAGFELIVEYWLDKYEAEGDAIYRRRV